MRTGKNFSIKDGGCFSIGSENTVMVKSSSSWNISFVSHTVMQYLDKKHLWRGGKLLYVCLFTVPEGTQCCHGWAGKAAAGSRLDSHILFIQARCGVTHL